MSLCSCYEQVQSRYCGMPLTLHVCNGTKEREECTCYGVESQCSFYPEKRNKANNLLSTAEMWISAQDDGETYVTDYMNTSYSKDDGFWSKNDQKKDITLSLNDWMNAMWKKQEKRKMTIEQAEKEFDIKIVR